MEKESWKRKHGDGGIIEEKSSRRNHVGFIRGGIIEEESSESHLGAIWKASGSHLGDVLEPFGSHLGAKGSHLEPSGKHLGSIWEAWAPKVLPRWSEGAETQKVLPLSAIIHFSIKKY